MSSDSLVRCPHCRELVSLAVVWGTSDLCPNCLRPLSIGVGLGQDSTAQPVGASASVVSRWIGAFNARDLVAMLAYMGPDVTLHPLRLPGLSRSYHGVDGVTRWFAQLEGLSHNHWIDVTYFRPVDANGLLVVGAVKLDRDIDEELPFWGLYAIRDELIDEAHHYLTEPSILESPTQGLYGDQAS
jgi:hypothetical protein